MQVCDFLNTQSPVIPMRSLSGFWNRNHEYPLKRDHVLLFYKQYLHLCQTVPREQRLMGPLAVLQTQIRIPDSD